MAKKAASPAPDSPVRPQVIEESLQNHAEAAIEQVDAPALPLKSIKVRATRPGYIGDGPLGMIYRNEGDVFTLKPRVVIDGDPDKIDAIPKTRTITAEQQFSHRWMEIVPDDEPERLTTAQAAINKAARG